MRVIFAHLRKRIIRQSQVYEPQYKEVDPHKEDAPDGFSRLLALMFGSKFNTSQPTFINCSHPKLSR
jgi:hypothetical protein